MNEPKHVSTEKLTCVVCEKVFEDAILDGDAESHEVANLDSGARSWGLCPEHQRLHAKGIVCLVEVQLRLGGAPRGVCDLLDVETIVRTGRVSHLPYEVLREAAPLPLDEMPVCVFVPSQIFDEVLQFSPPMH